MAKDYDPPSMSLNPPAPESSSPLDLEAIRQRYDDYCERSLNDA
jgi:hypothetical protein